MSKKIYKIYYNDQIGGLSENEISNKLLEITSSQMSGPDKTKNIKLKFLEIYQVIEEKLGEYNKSISILIDNIINNNLGIIPEDFGPEDEDTKRPVNMIYIILIQLFNYYNYLVQSNDRIIKIINLDEINQDSNMNLIMPLL
tara:strand:- start:5 stop:430 length:426 start_codon:yes stop_codon:yes gene_type:complete